MQIDATYLDKVFTISDPDARLRDPSDLNSYLKWSASDSLPAGAVVGGFKLIPVGTEVRVLEARLVTAGSLDRRVMGKVAATSGLEIGWTSTRNLRGRFVGETVGEVSPEAGAGRFADTAAWSKGNYIGQIELVEIVDSQLEIERIASSTAEAFLRMVAAAAADDVLIAINSGFRTYAEQKYLYEGFIAGKAGFNKAAPPGKSLHQNGVAFDIDVAGAFNSVQYDWLKRHATSHGFLRTVSGEPWHWELHPTEAAAAKAAGRHKRSGVNP
jgi:hypothetical protein